MANVSSKRRAGSSTDVSEVEPSEEAGAASLRGGRISKIRQAILKARWSRSLPPWIVAAAFALGVGLLLYVGRGMWFLADEWNVLLNRRELTLWHVMRPHNEHWIAFPALIYRGLLTMGHFSNYWPYYLTGIVFHTAATVTFWQLLRRLGTPPAPAQLTALSLLLMGGASEQIFNPFQLGWTAPIALYLLALLLLDRPGPQPRHDWSAAALLALAMPFGGVGLPLVLGLAIGLGLRREFRRLLLVAGPALLAYGTWRVIWGISPPLKAEVLWLLPSYMVHGIAASAAGFTGLPLRIAGALLVLFGVIAIVTAIRTGLPLSGWAAAFAVLAFFALAGISRVLQFGPAQAESSRYLYLGALLLLLGLAAMLRSAWAPGGVPLLAASSVLLAACLVVNVFALRDGARLWRGLKGESAVRIVAADRLLADGLQHVPHAQPDPHFAPDVTAEGLLQSREDGIPIGYDGPYQPTSTILEQTRLLLQTAFTPVESVTADLRLVGGAAAVTASGSGCAAVAALPGQELLVQSSTGRLSVVPKNDTVLRIRRTRAPADVFWDTSLTEGTRRQLELAVPASPGSVTGLLSLGFPQSAHLTLCGQSLVDDRMSAT